MELLWARLLGDYIGVVFGMQGSCLDARMLGLCPPVFLQLSPIHYQSRRPADLLHTPTSIQTTTAAHDQRHWFLVIFRCPSLPSSAPPRAPRLRLRHSEQRTHGWRPQVPRLRLDLYSFPACRSPYAIPCVFPVTASLPAATDSDATFPFQTQAIVPINVSTAATNLLEGTSLRSLALLRPALTSLPPCPPLLQ